MSRTTGHTTSSAAPSKEVEELKAKLEDSETRVTELKKEIEFSQVKLLELSKQIEEEAARVSSVEELLRVEHSAVVDKLRAKYETDVQELQAQLIQVEAAKTEAQAASLKAIEAAQAVAATRRSTEASEALEKLKKEHEGALAALNNDLTSSKAAHASATATTYEKESEVAILKVQIRNDTEALETRKDEHKATLAELKESITGEHEAAIQALKTAHEEDLSKAKSDVVYVHEKNVSDLTSKHKATISELKNKIEKAGAATLALEESHKEKIESHQSQSEANVAKLESQIAELKANAGAESDSTAKSTKEIEELSVKHAAAEKNLSSVQEELTAVSKTLEGLQAKSAQDEKALTVATSELSDAKEEVISLQKMMETFDAESTSKDEVHNKIKSELATTAKSLEEKTKEISLLTERHQKTLKAVSDDYQQEIDHLQGAAGVREEYEALKVQYEELSKSHELLLKSHSTAIEQIKQDHALAIVKFDISQSAQQKDLEDLKASHEIALADLKKSINEEHIAAMQALKSTHEFQTDAAYDRAIEASSMSHAADMEQVLAKHDDFVSELKKLHASTQAAALADDESSKTSENALKAQVAEQKAALEKIQSEFDAIVANLATEKTSKSSIQAELEALNKAVISEQAAKAASGAELKSTSDELARLRSELTALDSEFIKEKKEKISAISLADAELTEARESLAKAQAEVAEHKKAVAAAAKAAEGDSSKFPKALADAEAERDELAQQLAVEKMDKIVAQADLEAALSKKPDNSEANGLRKELQALKDQHQAALMTAQQESAKATEEHLATKAESEKIRRELSSQKAESTSDYKDMHESLTQLIEESNKKSVDLEARLKETEAHLKVKETELAEAKV